MLSSRPTLVFPLLLVSFSLWGTLLLGSTPHTLSPYNSHHRSPLLHWVSHFPPYTPPFPLASPLQVVGFLLRGNLLLASSHPDPHPPAVLLCIGGGGGDVDPLSPATPLHPLAVELYWRCRAFRHCQTVLFYRYSTLPNSR